MEIDIVESTMRGNTLLNIFVAFLLCTSVNCAEAEDHGDMLFLSPYIKNGSLELARNLSKVEPVDLFTNLSSYSGFITVDDQYNSNLWFWYFPAADGNPDAPLIVWLQGGSGISSLWGLLNEIGPFSYDGNNVTILILGTSGIVCYLLINPVGTGFSFTNSSEGYATNITRVGEQLYTFMVQFLKVYPELQQVPLYICGESYGGKFVPALAYQIHINNSTRDGVEMNLQGIAISNGLIDPASMFSKSDILYQLGFFDDDSREQFAKMEEKCLKYVLDGDYENADECNLDLNYFIIAKTGLATLNLYNYAEEYNTSERYELSPDFKLHRKLMNKVSVRKALHVGTTNFTHPSSYITFKMRNDIFGSSMKPQLEQLLEHYKVLLYNGQMGLMIPHPTAAKMYRKLNWSGSKEYLEAVRLSWIVDGVVVGYVKEAGNLMEVLVRNAGHSVPETQPERSLLLIESFIQNEALDYFSVKYFGYNYL